MRMQDFTTPGKTNSDTTQRSLGLGRVKRVAVQVSKLELHCRMSGVRQVCFTRLELLAAA